MPRVFAETFSGLSQLENQRIGQRDARFFQSLANQQAERDRLQQQANQQFQNTLATTQLMSQLRNQRIAQANAQQDAHLGRQLQMLDVISANQRNRERIVGDLNVEGIRAQGDLQEADLRATRDAQIQSRLIGSENARQQAQGYKDALQAVANNVSAAEATEAFGLDEQRAKALTAFEARFKANELNRVESIESKVDAFNAMLGKSQAAKNLILDTISKAEEAGETQIDKRSATQLSKALATHGFSLGADDRLVTSLRTKAVELEVETLKQLNKAGSADMVFDSDIGEFVPVIQRRYTDKELGRIKPQPKVNPREYAVLVGQRAAEYITQGMPREEAKLKAKQDMQKFLTPAPGSGGASSGF